MIVFLNEVIQVLLKFTERHVRIISNGRCEEFRVEDAVEVFAGLVMHPAAWVEGTVLNVRSSKDCLKRMDRRQATIFSRTAGTYTLDCHCVSLVKGQDLVLQDVGRIHRVPGGIHLRKTESGLGIYDRFNIDFPDALEIAEVLERAGEERLLEKQTLRIQRSMLTGFRLPIQLSWVALSTKR